MNIIPLIYIENGVLLMNRDGEQLSIDELFQRVQKDTMLYVLDFDGIEHDNPQLDLYQKLSDHCILWVDAGPRMLDDVMDMIMAGATNITLREELWPATDIHGIQEITEGEMYLAVDPQQEKTTIEPLLLKEIAGVIIFNNDNQNSIDFQFRGFFKEFATNPKIYLYDVPSMDVAYWEGRGVTGILVDLKKKEMV
jgi:uncharacterized protein related to proFAR isomerase